MKNQNGTAKAEHHLESLRDSVKGLVGQGQQKVTEIKDKVVDFERRAQQRGGAALGRAVDMIKQHPVAAVGIAFGIGYFAMRLVRR
jgi:ElaB/YqjD/DUF883 family membrane-anchored ribosome-binding protein